MDKKSDTKKAAKSGDSFFKKSDFESLQVFLAGENNTTNTKIQDLQSLSLVETRDDGCSIQVPNNSCSKGHLMAFQILFRGHFDIVFTGKVLEKTTGEHAKTIAIISLEFYQVEAEKWQKLQRLFAERQLELNNLIRRIKG